MKKRKESEMGIFSFFFLAFSKYFILVGKQTRLEENDGSKGLGFMGRNERFSRESSLSYRYTHRAERERERSGFFGSISCPA
jgi:hypothetical protein